MSNRLAAINEAALVGARLFSSLSPRADVTIGELPSGIPAQPSDLIAIFRDQTRQVSIASILGTGASPRAIYLYGSCSDFTPASTGFDIGSVRYVPFDPFAPGVPIEWKVVSIYLRTETVSASPVSIQIQRSTVAGDFTNANYINTSPLVLDYSSGNEVQIFTGASIENPDVNSGDKLGVQYTALGSGATGMTVIIGLVTTS